VEKASQELSEKFGSQKYFLLDQNNHHIELDV
jgi:hypothetical protein